MKKFLLYLVVAIVVVCCGVAIYYVVRNDEDIHFSSAEAKSIYLNVDETIEIPVVHERPNNKTKLEVSVGNDIVKINENDWSLTATGAGSTLVTITSSNKKFGPFEIVITVGNGSLDCPYYIRNEEDLQAIGSKKWALSSNYFLTKDIELTKNFTPIGSTANPFSGTFDGAGHIIKNLVIDESESQSTQPVGLFRAIGSTGRVEKLILENSDIKARAIFAGVVAGRNYGLIGKCQILNSKIQNVLNIEAYTGIVCGLNESKETYAGVRLCTVKAEIDSLYVAGGVVGYNKGGVLTNNHVEVVEANINPEKSVEAEALFGGLCGYSENSSGEVCRVIALNNLVFIDKINESKVVKGGIFGEILAENVESQGYYSMLLYNTPAQISPVGSVINENNLTSSNIDARNYSANITNSEITSKSTYTSISSSSWDFATSKNPNGIWLIVNNKEISINYVSEELTYQDLPLVGTVIEISDKNSLSAAINNMRIYPTAKITYVIKGSSEKSESVDENGKTILDYNNNPVIVISKEKTYTYTLKSDWEPIGTKEKPFAGSIIAEDDATITIKGLKVNGEYAGFFGVLDSGSIISNLIISDAEISGTVVGAVAGLQNFGTIKNCIVKNSKLTTNKYAGSIVGFSTGEITGCTASKNEITVTDSNEQNIYVGGIVAKTRGSVLSSTSSATKLDANNIQSEKNTLCMGGVAGFVENATISLCEVLKLDANSKKYLSRAYAGGVVGYALNSNIKNSGLTIDLDDGMANQIIVNNSHPYSIAGGLVGFMDGGKLSKSSVGTAVISSYNSGALVSYLTGEIEECFAGTTTTVEGEYVAGFVCNFFGNIKNSYTFAQLNGSEIEAGMVTYLWKDSEIENCFTYCEFKGEGSGYADTLTNYKSRPKDFGSIKNSIFVGNNNQTLAKKGFTDWYKEMIICRDGSKKVEVQITFAIVANKFNFVYENGLLGAEDSYSLFKKLSFSDEIWSFGSDYATSGISPTLKETFDSQFGYIVPLEQTEDKTEA